MDYFAWEKNVIRARGGKEGKAITMESFCVRPSTRVFFIKSSYHRMFVLIVSRANDAVDYHATRVFLLLQGRILNHNGDMSYVNFLNCNIVGVVKQ